MSVKSAIVGSDETIEQFPCLMIAENGEVVLFISSCCGTSIVGNNKIGEYSEYWDMSRFKLFTGKVELSNN
jgi:hypothetical protein